MENPVEKMLDAVDWKELEKPDASELHDGIPFATHSGILKICDIEIECVMLSDGRRLLTGKAMHDLVSGLLDLQT